MGAGVRLITGVVSFVSDDDEHEEMTGINPSNAVAIRKDGFLIPPRVSDIRLFDLLDGQFQFGRHGRVFAISRHF